jgi:hypothetical protein
VTNFSLRIMAICCLSLLPTIVYADTKKIEWTENGTNLWIALHQSWGNIRFSAVKFHLGYYRMSLVDVEGYRDNNIERVRAANDNRKFSNELLDVGISVIYKTWPDRANIVAVAPAGWSTSLRKIDHAGFLRIGGKDHFDFEDRPSLSAILCLDSPFYKGYDYQVPTFYQFPEQTPLGEKCDDSVQVGPRILEDTHGLRHGHDPHGIPESESSIRAQMRVIFAVDDPGRSLSRNNKSRVNARDGYIIVTETPAHLYDIQQMLLSPDFYGNGAGYLCAINMAGGGPSGLIVRGDSSGTSTIIGNSSGVIGSALVITSVPGIDK